MWGLRNSLFRLARAVGVVKSSSQLGRIQSEKNSHLSRTAAPIATPIAPIVADAEYLCNMGGKKFRQLS